MRTTTFNNAMRDFATITDAMNRTFGQNVAAYDFARNGGYQGKNGETQSAKLRLPVDVWAKDEAFVITAYLPGVNPETVDITLEGEELTIRGEFPTLTKEEGVEFLKNELYRGAFERRMTFNVPVNVEAIEATYENGLLTLRVPKAEVVRPKQIKVVVK